MKKISFIIFSIAISAVLFTSCEKDDSHGTGALPPPSDTNDHTPPVITLMGADPWIVSLNSSYVDPGATAVDDEDGSVAVTSSFSSTNPDVNLAGTYSITYTASDLAGNHATATRTVIVRNDAYYLEGTYNVDDTCGLPFMILNYPQTITASITVNNRIHFSKFSDYTNNTGIYADVIGSSITLPFQTANNIGWGDDHQFAGTGSVVNLSPVILHLNYSDTNISTSTTANCSAWFYVQ